MIRSILIAILFFLTVFVGPCTRSDNFIAISVSSSISKLAALTLYNCQGYSLVNITASDLNRVISLFQSCGVTVNQEVCVNAFKGYAGQTGQFYAQYNKDGPDVLLQYLLCQTYAENITTASIQYAQTVISDGGSVKVTQYDHGCDGKLYGHSFNDNMVTDSQSSFDRFHDNHQHFLSNHRRLWWLLSDQSSHQHRGNSIKQCASDYTLHSSPHPNGDHGDFTWTHFFVSTFVTTTVSDCLTILNTVTGSSTVSIYTTQVFTKGKLWVESTTTSLTVLLLEHHSPFN